MTGRRVCPTHGAPLTPEGRCRVCYAVEQYRPGLTLGKVIGQLVVVALVAGLALIGYWTFLRYQTLERAEHTETPPSSSPN